MTCLKPAHLGTKPKTTTGTDRESYLYNLLLAINAQAQRFTTACTFPDTGT